MILMKLSYLFLIELKFQKVRLTANIVMPGEKCAERTGPPF